MNVPILLLLTASAATLVLRTGERIVTVGAPVRQGTTITFRGPGGALYSIPASEIDPAATEAANAVEDAEGMDAGRKPIVVSPADRSRLLKDLEQNHSGTVPPRQTSLETPPPESAPADTAAKNEEEWRWRREARGHQEAIRQARENLSLLTERAESLRAEIRGLLSLGYKPRDFSYETTVLANVEEQIPAAQLEVTRAERAWDQFRDDARRQGILPGWLR